MDVDIGSTDILSDEQQIFDAPYEIGDELVVVEDELSERPITDRKLVVDMINSLATRTYKALVGDRANNRRYARILTISNKLRDYKSKRRRFKRELLKVRLPLSAISWNDLDSDDIQILMFRRLISIYDSYPWWKTRVILSSFMSESTREMLEKEMAGDEDEEEEEEDSRPDTSTM